MKSKSEEDMECVIHKAGILYQEQHRPIDGSQPEKPHEDNIGRSSQKSPRMNDNHTTSLLEQGYIHGHASFLLGRDSVKFSRGHSIDQSYMNSLFQYYEVAPLGKVHTSTAGPGGRGGRSSAPRGWSRRS